MNQFLHLQQFGRPVLDVLDLGLGDIRCKPGKSGEKQHQMTLEFIETLTPEYHRINPKRTVAEKFYAVEPSVGGGYLVLRAYILPDDVALDMNRLAGKFMIGDVVALEGTQGIQQADRKRRTRTKPGTGRQIAVMVDLETGIALHVAQHGTNRWMLDLVDRFAVFDFRIHDAELMLEERGQVATADIAILVYGCGQHDTTVFLVPGCVIGSPSKKGYPERCPGNYHWSRLNRPVFFFSA